jgi:hypothetical protein
MAIVQLPLTTTRLARGRPWLLLLPIGHASPVAALDMAA